MTFSPHPPPPDLFLPCSIYIPIVFYIESHRRCWRGVFTLLCPALSEKKERSSEPRPDTPLVCKDRIYLYHLRTRCRIGLIHIRFVPSSPQYTCSFSLPSSLHFVHSACTSTSYRGLKDDSHADSYVRCFPRPVGLLPYCYCTETGCRVQHPRSSALCSRRGRPGDYDDPMTDMCWILQCLRVVCCSVASV